MKEISFVDRGNPSFLNNILLIGLIVLSIITENKGILLVTLFLIFWIILDTTKIRINDVRIKDEMQMRGGKR